MDVAVVSVLPIPPPAPRPTSLTTFKVSWLCITIASKAGPNVGETTPEIANIWPSQRHLWQK